MMMIYIFHFLHISLYLLRDDCDENITAGCPVSIIHALDHIEAAIISDIQHQRVIIVLPALKKTLTCDALTTLIAHQIYTLHNITSKNPIIGPNPSLILRLTSYQEKVT